VVKRFRSLDAMENDEAGSEEDAALVQQLQVCHSEFVTSLSCRPKRRYSDLSQECLGDKGIPCRGTKKDIQHVAFYIVGVAKCGKPHLFYDRRPKKDYSTPTEVLKDIYEDNGLDSKNIKVIYESRLSQDIAYEVLTGRVTGLGAVPMLHADRKEGLEAVGPIPLIRAKSKEFSQERWWQQDQFSKEKKD
jgi:hypothetical protein